MHLRIMPMIQGLLPHLNQVMDILPLHQLLELLVGEVLEGLACEERSLAALALIVELNGAEVGADEAVPRG